MSSSNQANYYVKLVIAVIFTGVAAGLVGTLLSALLHLIQHWAYGYSLDHIISHESFLQGVRNSSNYRRILALTLCGLIAGIGWWAVFRFCKKLKSIPNALNDDPTQMPIIATFCHDFLQIITVALGSPLGREVAPREMAATVSSRISKYLKLTIDDTKVLFACGAGAGLAAVYNVPLGGAIFSLEVLLVSLRWRCVIPAIVTSVVASIIPWFWLGNVHQYHFGEVQATYSLLGFAAVSGPIIGIAAFYFAKITATMKSKAPKDRRLIPLCFFNFVMIGLLAIPFPELLGNGKGAIQLVFDNQLTLQMVAIILVLRFIVTLSSLRVGADGGVLTPGLLHGAFLAILLGGIWNLYFPLLPMIALAIVGATAFLASSMKMPVTAIILVMELTHANHDVLFPMLLAVGGSLAMSSLLKALTSKQ